MSGNTIEEALLNQKNEFLRLELEETKTRESNLKKLNDSLMQAIQHNLPLRDNLLEELKKSNDQLTRDIDNLKLRYSEKSSSLEKVNYDLLISNKELKIELKQEKIKFESEKCELHAKIKTLENEKFSLEKQMRELSGNNDEAWNKIKFQMELKLHEANREMEIHRDESRNEVNKVRQEADAAIFHLKSMFNKETDTLKSEIKSLQIKIHHQKDKIEKLKQADNIAVYQKRIENLNSQLESYRYMIEKNLRSPKASTLPIENQAESPQNNSFYEDRPLQMESRNRILSSQKNSLSLCENCEALKGELKVKDEELQDALIKLECSLLQKEKTELEIGRLKIETQENNLQHQLSAKNWKETEIALKNEIKYLIGKLLKAKSKLAVGDVTSTVRKDPSLTSFHSLSVRRERNSNYQSPLRQSNSPLNFSEIVRCDSPLTSDISLNRCL
ncbi:unnamed protein product [Blepharisma stoltei]|uniref:Uncharacterized protein n=1 Tax=Blepharisma stoltei TaxID=1481888 RepID=A0AAU9KAN7_9CILI|nr:unnamed protein product [Blepharisma stoltei]